MLVVHLFHGLPRDPQHWFILYITSQFLSEPDYFTLAYILHWYILLHAFWTLNTYYLLQTLTLVAW